MHEHNLCCNVWQVRREHEDVRKRRLDEFMAGFNCISLRLKEMYQMITLGGDAELELVDSLDPFSEACSLPCGAYLLCLLALVLRAFQSLPLSRAFWATAYHQGSRCRLPDCLTFCVPFSPCLLSLLTLAF